MSQIFRHPEFRDRSLELRCEKDEVCVYATEDGLRRLIELCTHLLNDPKAGHVHLEDYEILTADSLRGSIALFPQGR